MALSRANSWLMQAWLKPVLWLVCALPALQWLMLATQTHLTAQDAEVLSAWSGIWSMRFVWLALLVTPLREIAGLPGLIRFRRTFGVSAFAYALLHVLSYVAFAQGWHWADAWAEIQAQTVLWVGVLAFLVMLPLGLTSFNGAVRWLGGRHWQRLHKLVYVLAGLALWHFYLHREPDQAWAEVMFYAVTLAAMLGWRLVRRGGVLAMFQIR